MPKRRNIPPLMPREERLKLLNVPLSFRIIPPKSWGGTIVFHGDHFDIPVDGHRTYPSVAWEDGWESISRLLEDQS